jgi:hypothetical protein
MFIAERFQANILDKYGQHTFQLMEVIGILKHVDLEDRSPCLFPF